MNKKELKELVKKYFSLTEMTEETNTTENTELQFAEATLVDGTKVTNKKDSEFEVGDELYVITEEGEEVLAPSGEHTTESGITVTVDGEGKITGLARPDEGAEGELAEHEDEMKEEMSSEEVVEESAEVTEDTEKTEMAEDEEEMMDEDIKEVIIDAIMAEVGPMISEMKTEMDNCMAKLAEHEEKLKEHMSAPAAKPTSESRFSKSKQNVEAPAAVYNVKRYEAALNRINNK